MANLSTAFGTVTIFGDSLEIIERILNAHNEAQRSAYIYYDTTIDMDINPDRVKTPGVHEAHSGDSISTPGNISVEFDFTGTGRNSFQNNVGWFIEEILESDPDLKKVSFGAIFEFNDAESGRDFIYNSTMMTDYSPENGVETVTLIEGDEVPYTVENLVDFGFYGIDDVFDQEWILNNRETVLDKLDDLLENDTSSKNEKINFIANHPDDFFEFIEDSPSYGLVEYLPDLLELYLEEFDIEEVILKQIDNIDFEKDIFQWMDLHKIEMYDSIQGSLIDNFVVWLPAELSSFLGADAIFFEEEFRNSWSSSYCKHLLSKEDAYELIDEVEKEVLL